MELPVKYSRIPRKERWKVRNAYVEKQEGLCYHCEGPLDKDPPSHIIDHEINWSLFPAGFLIHPVHLHHSHDTDMTLGAVHAYCNAVLWQYHGE